MMPVLFVGHGNPMNAIEDNIYSRNWRSLGERLPIPKCILVISAHWLTEGSFTQGEESPAQIYDMYGFPRELYTLKYPAKGSPFYARKVKEALGVEELNDWGIDHGTWSVLCHMFPQADIPVLQLSIDALKTYRQHYELGQKLRKLREEGILIIGSGNIVHNLRLVDWRRQGGFSWAIEFDDFIEEQIKKSNHTAILDHPMTPAVPTTEHFVPLLYVLGAANILDEIEVFNKACDLGSISMTGYLFYRK